MGQRLIRYYRPDHFARGIKCRPFLILPPLIVRNFTRTMHQFCLAASILGGVSSVLGFWIAYEYDLPVGPTDIALLRVIYAITFALRKGAKAIWRSA